jgi:hypothetical protein
MIAFITIAIPSNINLKGVWNGIEDIALSKLDDAIENCVNVTSGIASQYFYRSLYLPQLYNCWKVIFHVQ